MNKILLSVIFLVVLLIGGYFADDTYRAKVDSMFGIGQTQSQPTAVAATPTAPAVIRTAPATSSDTLDAILKKGVITISVQSPAPPFYENVRGRMQGFNIDFLNLLLEQDGFRGKVHSIQAAEVGTYAAVPEQLLKPGVADIAIDGLTFTDQDLPGVVYSIPYVKDFGYSLIAPANSGIQSASDLVGARIGIMKGDPDVRATAERAFPGATLIEVDETADASGTFIPRYFKNKQVDAFVYDYPFAVNEIKGTDLQFVMPKIPGSDIQYRIGVRKEDRNLLVAINGAIRQALDTDTYRSMLKQYFMSNNTAAVRRASASEQTYVVAKGDTLSTIAQAKLGDKMRYGEIQVRNNLANPDFISVGQRLVIPK